MKTILSVAAGVLYFALAGAWIFDVHGLRQILPFYVIVAGAVGVACLLPKPKREEEETELSFLRWALDHFAIVGVVLGAALFVIASGAAFNEPIELNIPARVGIWLVILAYASIFVPRRWVSRPKRS